MKVIDPSINAKVPNIPILEFDKTEEGYIFKSDFGNLRFKDENEIYIINDLEIKIKDKIYISFSMIHRKQTRRQSMMLKREKVPIV